MRRFALLVPCAALAFSTPHTAGTLTVGPPGSGAEFTTLAAAVAASQPHDTVLVLPGIYPGAFATFHPLRIVGIGLPILGAQGQTTAVLWKGPAYGPEDATLLAGLRVFAQAAPFTADPVALFSHAPLVAVGCQFERMQIGATAERALLDGCVVTELAASGLDLTLNRCHMQGDTFMPGVFGSFDSYGTPAVSLTGCTTSLTRCTLVGGYGADSSPSESSKASGGDALSLDGGFALVRGGPGSLLQGGAGAHVLSPFPGDWPGGYAIATAGGATVTLQAQVPVFGGLDGTLGIHPAVQDPSAVTSTATVYPSAGFLLSPLEAGEAGTLELAGAPGAPAWLGVSAGFASPAAVPGVEGTLLLDPASLVVIPLALPASGASDLAFTLPAEPALSGLDFGAQLLTEAGGALLLSDPTLLVVP